MNKTLKKLFDIKSELYKPFPYKDTDNIQEDFRSGFLNLSDEESCLTGDFNTYCMNIAGTLSYVLTGNTSEIPERQIKILQYSFFDFFKQYKFFEDKITDYKDFNQQYRNFEETRNLLLQFLSK